MIYTNSTTKFKTVLNHQIQSARSLDICVGYCANKTILSYSALLTRIATYGRVRLILGMYKNEGAFPLALYKTLIKLHDDLVKASQANQINGSGVYICKKDYHGKIYIVNQDSSELIYLGSNNFSEAGLDTRLEACTTIQDLKDIREIKAYINFLCSPAVSVTIDKFAFTKVSKTQLSNLPSITVLPSNLILDGSIQIPLNVDAQRRSALNLCFGSGRVDKKGVYTPRPWYEVEISSSQQIRSNSLYPQTNNVAAMLVTP